MNLFFRAVRPPQSRTNAFALLLFFGSLTGCEPTPEDIANGYDPIAALEVPARSTRYTGDFWMREHDRNPERYREAVALCRGREPADYPNCQEVMRAEVTRQALESPRLEGRTYSGQSTPPARLQAGSDTTDR